MITFYPANDYQPKNILFSADWHLFHDKDFLYGPRGFSNEEEHTQYIIEKALELREHQILFFLGDFALNVKGRDYLLTDFLSDLKCKLVMLWGNHNSYVKQLYKRCISYTWGDGFARDGYEFYPLETIDDVVFAGDLAKVRISKREEYYLGHFPQPLWDKVNHGTMFLCGHSHGNFPGANVGDKGAGKILDVGIENGMKNNGSFAPFFSLDDIRYIMKYKPIRNTETNTH